MNYKMERGKRKSSTKLKKSNLESFIEGMMEPAETDKEVKN